MCATSRFRTRFPIKTRSGSGPRVQRHCGGLFPVPVEMARCHGIIANTECCCRPGDVRTPSRSSYFRILFTRRCCVRGDKLVTTVFYGFRRTRALGRTINMTTYAERSVAGLRRTAARWRPPLAGHREIVSVDRTRRRKNVPIIINVFYVEREIVVRYTHTIIYNSLDTTPAQRAF